LTFRGLVFDYENYSRHIFANATVNTLLLERMKTVFKFVSFFETRIIF